MSVLMDRAIGMVVLVWLGAVGLLLFPDYAVPHAVRDRDFPARSGTSCRRLTDCLLLRRVLPEDGHQLVVKLRLALRSYRTHWRALLMRSYLSLLVHLIQAWMHVVMGRALGFERAVFFLPSLSIRWSEPFPRFRSA